MSNGIRFFKRNTNIENYKNVWKKNALLLITTKTPFVTESFYLQNVL